MKSDRELRKLASAYAEKMAAGIADSAARRVREDQIFAGRLKELHAQQAATLAKRAANPPPRKPYKAPSYAGSVGTSNRRAGMGGRVFTR